MSQPSNNEANNYPRPLRRDPGGIRAEHGFLLLGSMALTAAVALCAMDHFNTIDFSRGVYSILTGLFVVGGCGWLSRSAERRSVQGMRGEVTRLRVEIADLRAAQRAAAQWSPPWGRAVGGNMYVSQTSIDTVPLQTPIAPDTAAALHRIGLRLLPGGDEK